ncbi:MAG: CAP domain-containing protein [Candidatus Saccharimonadales bacterium]
MVIASASQSPHSAQHKKRQGQHHKVSKHYVKTYWPYLPMLIIVIVGFVINIGLSAGQGVLSYATSMSPSALLQETNIQRGSNDRAALSLSNKLSQAAQQKANDMVARNYWSHTSPEGTQPWQVISSVGYSYTTAGENLAYGFDTSAGAMAGWMNSPGHKANVLNVNYTEVGFGIANSPDFQGDGEQTVVVAMYASPKKAAPAPVAKAKPTTPAATPTPTKTITPITPVAPATPPTPDPTPVATAEPTKEPETVASQQPVNEDTVVPEENTQQLTSKEVARVDILTSGNAEWVALALAALISIGAITFVYRHLKMWRKFLVRGEAFVIHHPILDTVLVAVIVAGFILTQATGVIH